MGSSSYLFGTDGSHVPTGGLTTAARQCRKLVGMRPTDRKRATATEYVRSGVTTAAWQAEEAPTQAHAAAQAIDLVKTYGVGQAEVCALVGVSVNFEKGQFTAVMGPSGSGKSTLMHCMAGLDVPTSGHAYVGEQDVAQLDDTGLTELRRDHIGFIFQSFNLVPTLTARENVVLPADLAGTRVDSEWFDYLVGQLRIGDRLSHRPSEMSGGQQQRVACARALIGRPDLIFADSPRETSTRMPQRRCCRSCANRWSSSGSRSSWSPTTPAAPPTPIGSCSLLTARWWAIWRIRQPTRCSSR